MNKQQYEVRITPAAERQLKKIDRRQQLRIAVAISLLAKTPRPPGARALSGQRGKLRIRVANYRIIYTIDEGKLIVEIITVGHRRDVYKK